MDVFVLVYIADMSKLIHREPLSGVRMACYRSSDKDQQMFIKIVLQNEYRQVLLHVCELRYIKIYSIYRKSPVTNCEADQP